MSLVPSANILIQPELTHWLQPLQKSHRTPKLCDVTSIEKNGNLIFWVPLEVLKYRF